MACYQLAPAVQRSGIRRGDPTTRGKTHGDDGPHTEPEFRRIFAEEPLPEWVFKSLQSALTDSVVTSAHAAIDAASIVMAQSILDDCAWSYLKVCAIIAPEDWRDEIDTRKIELKEIREHKYEHLRDRLIEERLQQLARESLLKKIDRLYTLCHPPADYVPANNYAYDRSRIERIDKARHAVIHENDFEAPLPKIEEDLEYMEKTGWSMMGLVNQRYGLQIDPTRLLEQPAAKQYALARIGIDAKE